MLSLRPPFLPGLRENLQSRSQALDVSLEVGILAGRGWSQQVLGLAGRGARDEGFHQLKIMIDKEKAVGERTENDNQYIKAIEVES